MPGTDKREIMNAAELARMMDTWSDALNVAEVVESPFFAPNRPMGFARLASRGTAGRFGISTGQRPWCCHRGRDARLRHAIGAFSHRGCGADLAGSRSGRCQAAPLWPEAIGL